MRTTTSVKPGLCSSPVHDYLEQLHTEFSQVADGQVATYIPELAKANPNWFGICLVTMNGSVYEVGDSAQAFTIQSISKAVRLWIGSRGPWPRRRARTGGSGSPQVMPLTRSASIRTQAPAQSDDQCRRHRNCRTEFPARCRKPGSNVSWK